MKKIRFCLINIPIISTIFLTVACSNFVKDDDKKDPDPQISNFGNTLVNERSEDINVRGKNYEEGLKIKSLYEPEISKLEKKDIEFGKGVKKQDLTMQQAYDLKHPNYGVYSSGYKQILIGVDFNLFCLENNGTFEKMMKSDNKQEVIDFYTKSPSMLKVNNEFNLNFTYGKTYMSNEDSINKSQNPGTNTEKNNGLKVSNYLNNQFETQSQKFKDLNGYMQTKGGGHT